MKQSILLLAGLGLIWACGDVEETEPAQKASVQLNQQDYNSDLNVIPRGPEDREEDGAVSAAELELLAPFLEDLRGGIREFSPNSIGLCKGQGKDCTEFLGLDVGILPEGKYMIRGDFQAPELKPEEGWKVTFNVDCEITRENGDSTTTTTKNYSKEYKVSHVNRTEYGYRLSPLYNIESPSARGEHICTWSITAHNLDEERVWKGGYTIPAK